MSFFVSYVRTDTRRIIYEENRAYFDKFYYDYGIDGMWQAGEYRRVIRSLRDCHTGSRNCAKSVLSDG